MFVDIVRLVVLLFICLLINFSQVPTTPMQKQLNIRMTFTPTSRESSLIFLSEGLFVRLNLTLAGTGGSDWPPVGYGGTSGKEEKWAVHWFQPVVAGSGVVIVAILLY